MTFVLGENASAGEGDFCEWVVVSNRRGLHARAAAKFVRVVDAFRADVQVTKDGVTVSGHSIMGLMMLAAAQGTQLKLCVSGAEALPAMEALADLVRRGFDEDA